MTTKIPSKAGPQLVLNIFSGKITITLSILDPNVQKAKREAEPFNQMFNSPIQSVTNNKCETAGACGSSGQIYAGSGPLNVQNNECLSTGSCVSTLSRPKSQSYKTGYPNSKIMALA